VEGGQGTHGQECLNEAVGTLDPSRKLTHCSREVDIYPTPILISVIVTILHLFFCLHLSIDLKIMLFYGAFIYRSW